ncbi:hypothetical protein BGX21_010607 [Mortierella sp. AD011]|nr:hypothetical protein BGX20_011726 [Mortierella sp. AD010]KAF9393837.1 hypothetical protein BGX21_010607 [Mortierella sp. AD011]
MSEKIDEKDKQHASGTKRAADDSELSEVDSEIDDDLSNDGKDEEDALEDEGEEYEVEKVVGHKRERGVLSFLLKWQGYDDADNTWETSDNLSCEELINEYWERYEKAGGKKSDLKGSDSKPQIPKRGSSSTKSTASPSKQSTSAKQSSPAKQSTTTKQSTPVKQPTTAKQQTATKQQTSSKAVVQKQETPTKSSASATSKKNVRDDSSSMGSPAKKQKVNTSTHGTAYPTSEAEDDFVSAQDETGSGDDDEGWESANGGWMPPKSWTSWDEHLDHVQTVERTKRSMIIHLKWKNGKDTEHPIEEAHVKCPQTLIRFYESHLKFTQA